ncbi:hypothetical protein HID58_075397 [Brassica napus]|uniref:Uncharacterized protein n=1 Tax=Brassica napus TaxID=3708 RepID=A0ABQ7YJJ6_BRANA|nr:hypothetical protein HID58_075397 [Brassica napus]
MTREDKEVLSLVHHELRKIGITDRNLRSNSISGIFHNFEMAVVKLLQECRCISYHVGGESFKLDMDLEMKLSSIILKQLDDVAGDASGLAVKCLAPLVKKVGEEHIAAEGKSKYDGVRGIISDKWSMRILWDCALGSAVAPYDIVLGLYMVAVERQTQNRARALA